MLQKIMLFHTRKTEQKLPEKRRYIFCNRILVNLKRSCKLQKDLVPLGRLQMLHHIQKMLPRLKPVDDPAPELQQMKQM